MNKIYELSQDEIDIFYSETSEYIKKLNTGIASLYSHRMENGTLRDLLRAAHSLKGIGGMVGHDLFVEITHNLESIFEGIANHSIGVNDPLINSCIEALDTLTLIRDEIINAENCNHNAVQTITCLKTLSSGIEPDTDPPDIEMINENDDFPRFGEYLIMHGCITESQLQDALTEQKNYQKDKPLLGKILVSKGYITETALDRIIAKLIIDQKTELNKRKSIENTYNKNNGVNSININIATLESLFEKVKSLVSLSYDLKSTFTGNTEKESDHQDHLKLRSITKKVNAIHNEMVLTLAKAYTYPIEKLFSSYEQLVSQYCIQSGKKAILDISSSDLLINKSIVETLNPILIHLIKNGLDHGIEAPAIRLIKNKPAEGSIKLSAGYDNEQIYIHVDDDGKGIDFDEIINVAINSGYLNPTKVEKLTHAEIIDLLCRHGFTTHAIKSNISGRGLGLEIVKNNIKKLNGDIDITSQKDEGTRITLTLPLKNALIPSLIFNYQDFIYAVPAESIKFISHSSNENPISELISINQWLKDNHVQELWLDKDDNKFTNTSEGKFLIIKNTEKNYYCIHAEKIIGFESLLPLIIFDRQETATEMPYSVLALTKNKELVHILDIDKIKDNGHESYLIKNQ